MPKPTPLVHLLVTLNQEAVDAAAATADAAATPAAAADATTAEAAAAAAAAADATTAEAAAAAADATTADAAFIGSIDIEDDLDSLRDTSDQEKLAMACALAEACEHAPPKKVGEAFQRMHALSANHFSALLSCHTKARYLQAPSISDDPIKHYQDVIRGIKTHFQGKKMKELKQWKKALSSMPTWAKDEGWNALMQEKEQAFQISVLESSQSSALYHH